MRGKLIVVGGGVMGLSIALNAARRTDPLTDPVLLLERGQLGAGSSGRSGAILRQHYSDRVTAGMARDSLKYYSKFERATGRIIGFQRPGVLTLAGPTRPEDVDLLKRNVEMQVSIGIDTRVVEEDEIRELAPGIEVAPGTVGAFEPDGGIVDPRRTIESFGALARENGVVTRLGTEVTRLLIEEGRVVGVETNRGEARAELVVVASGPWTRRLLAGAGIDFPLEVVRPEQAFIAMPSVSGDEDVEFASEADDPADTPMAESSTARLEADVAARFASADLVRPTHPVLLDMELGFYAKCEPAYLRTRVGAMSYEKDEVLDDPDAIAEEVSDEYKQWAHEVLAKRVPAYAELSEAGSEAAWYTLTPDSQAIIGPVGGVEGLFVVSGFSGHGFKMAPSIGEGVTQMVFGDPVAAFDPKFFAPDRFEGAAAPTGRGFGL